MRLGVVGDESPTNRIQELAESEGATVASGPASDVLDSDPEAVVAVGESALLALVREGLDVPVLPIDAGPGYGGVASGSTLDESPATDESTAADESTTDDSPATEESATDESAISESAAIRAVEALLAGEFERESRAVLGVSVDGERVGRALADATLVTAEPARISEYAIHSDGEQVEQLRADGVVVSTPTGSHGYGRSAGGPLLEPGSGVVGVVPIAPFAMNVDHWILSATQPTSLSVERDEGEVSLLLDDRTVQAVPPHTSVEVVADDAIDVIRVPESRSFFQR